MTPVQPNDLRARAEATTVNLPAGEDGMDKDPWQRRSWEPPADTGTSVLELKQTSSRIWRRGWDSNPRWYRYHAGFQDRCLKPLGHLSGSGLTF